MKETWPSVGLELRRRCTPSSVGQLGVGGRAVQLGLELGDGLLERRALVRTERGTQSIDRSSSSMLPLIRAMA